MKTNVYKDILVREAYYEKKLRQAERKVVITLEEARKNSQIITKKIIDQTKINLSKQEKNLEEQYEQQVETLNKQLTLAKKQLERKKILLPDISKTIVQSLMKEWVN